MVLYRIEIRISFSARTKNSQHRVFLELFNFKRDNNVSNEAQPNINYPGP